MKVITFINFLEFYHNSFSITFINFLEFYHNSFSIPFQPHSLNYLSYHSSMLFLVLLVYFMYFEDNV